EWQGPKPESGISSAAREARYRLLCQAAQDVGANIILTGHTADDQMETVAMRSTRGSAPDRPGLAGMAEVVLLHRRQWLVRPLLRTRRAAIRGYLRQKGHTWAEDPSNGDIRYERARTRKVLEGGSLDRLLEIDAAASRRCGLSEAAAGLLAEHASVHNAVLMRISPAGLAAEPAVLRYGLAHSAAVLGGREQAPGKSSMERVMRALVQGERTRIAAGRVIFDFRRDGLFLCRETRDLPDLTVPAQAILPWDGRFRVANTGTAAVSVGPGDVEGRAAELFPDAPASVALRAVRALPDVKRDRDAVVFKPILAPFDRFLPQFDLKLACVLAALFGCDNFPPFPLVDSEWKR
ncbi:MAG TPA: tRNA lysidine(34) synthetase TilS, partial [Pseudorhizobium sp.]|nr:tRNA lysidine(34) synthetase TilS [Pseudorhizobium sp.]